MGWICGHEGQTTRTQIPVTPSRACDTAHSLPHSFTPLLLLCALVFRKISPALIANSLSTWAWLSRRRKSISSTNPRPSSRGEESIRRCSLEPLLRARLELQQRRHPRRLQAIIITSLIQLLRIRALRSPRLLQLLAARCIPLLLRRLPLLRPLLPLLPLLLPPSLPHLRQQRPSMCRLRSSSCLSACPPVVSWTPRRRR